MGSLESQYGCYRLAASVTVLDVKSTIRCWGFASMQHLRSSDLYQLVTLTMCWTSPDLTGPDQTVPDRTGLDQTVPDSTRRYLDICDWTGLNRTGLDQTGPDQIRTEMTRPDLTGPDWSEPNCTQPDPTQPNPTQLCLTVPDCTGPVGPDLI